MSRVRAVVLNHDGGKLVEQCVDALYRTEWPADQLEIVLVDNASTDGSAETVGHAFPRTCVIRSTTNAGFPANNLAMRDLDDVDYVALINNDALVDPGWLPPLVGALDSDPQLGAACPKIVFAADPGTINNVGSIVYVDGYGADRGFGECDAGQFDTPEDVFAWCGAGVLLRPAMLDDVGLFDERFFLYYEDTDLSWRGQSRGWRYRYVPQSRVRHVHAATTGAGSARFLFYNERNRLVMLVKNAAPRLALRAAMRFPLSTLSYALRGRQWGTALVRTRAYAGFLALLPIMLRERRRLRRRQTVPDAVIERWFVSRPQG